MTAPDHDPQVRALLGSLREDPADDGFAARLHLRLSEAGMPSEPSAFGRWAAWLRERPWLVGGLAGAVSGVAAFALASSIAGGGPASVARQGRAPTAVPAGQSAVVAAAEPAAERETAPTAAACPPGSLEASAEVFVVPVGKVAMVQLHFAVDHDVDEAEFSVLLPEGLAFFSDGEAQPERAFHWSAPLARGDNRVPVAVIGAQPGRHRLAATATIAGEVVVHEIVLDVQGPA